MIRVQREANPRQCDNCPRTSLVLFYAVGGKTIRICTDCWRKLSAARDELYAGGLDAVEKF